MAETKKTEQDLVNVLKVDLKKRVDACRELAITGSRDAVPVLAGLLADEKMSHMARYALEPIPDPSVDQVLRDAAGKLEGKCLVGVAGSLGVRRDPKSAKVLAGLLGKSDPDVVATAARSLSRIATREAAEALRSKLGGAGATVRQAVADACLSCADRLAAAGERDEAATLYKAVAQADVPAHVRAAAERGATAAK